MKKFDLKAVKITLKIMLPAIILSCAALVFSGCAKINVTNIESRGTNIVCFGDSITVGFGAPEGKDYPSALAKMISAPVINAGLNGDISSEALKRLDSDVLEKDPLLVIVEFGGNDFLRQIPLEETVSNMEEMVKRIHAAGAMVAIADISTSIVMGQYGKEYKALSKKYQTAFIPKLLDGIVTDPELKSDFIHPNAQGYKIIAHRAYRAIIPHLNQNSILRSLRGKM
jgi:lysophospholipase L1-like esterase